MFKRYTLVLISFLVILLSACGESSDAGSPSDTLTRDQDNSSVKTADNNEGLEVETQEKKPTTTSGILKAHFIDVGSADAILLEYADDEEQYNILIDSGDWNSQAAVNYLKQAGIDELDIVIGTHPHADHIGQIHTMIEQFTVGEVWMSGDTSTSQVFERVIDAIDKHDVGYHEPRAGEVYDIGPLVMEIISPETISGNPNNGSISMRLAYGDVSFLFTGDAEKSAEDGMLARGHNLKADILKLGHHGSNTSTTPAFLEAVSPKVGVITVGKADKYGHPDKEVIDLVNKKEMELYSTHVNGTIVIETDGNTYSIATNADGTVTPQTGISNEEPSNGIAKKDNEDSSHAPKPTGDCIDINSATVEEIQEIIHIGPERAKELITLRPYKSIDDLSKINGIGPARIKDIRAQNKACTGG